MKFNKASGERGLIKMILVIIVALLIISYFGINIRALVNSPTTQDNVSYVWNGTIYIWDHFLKGPVTYLWKIFIDLVWKSALNSIKDGTLNPSTLMGSSTPGL